MKRAYVFKRAKGFWGRGKNNYRITANRVDKALVYSYRDRRNKKRDMRRAWIGQINAASRQFGYSQFMDGLVKSDIVLNRKMLAEIAVSEPFSFQQLVREVREAINFRDQHKNRIYADYYDRYKPLELPKEWQDAPVFESNNFAHVRQHFAKAQAKADEINQQLLSSGKAVLPSIEPKSYKRPPKSRASNAAKS